MSKWVHKVPIKYTVATSNSSYLFFDKDSMQQIADAIGDGYMLRTFENANDSESVYIADGIYVPKKSFSCICKAGDLDHCLYFYKYSSNIRVGVCELSTGNWTWTNTFPVVNYFYIRNISKSIKMIFGYPSSNPSGTLILANGKLSDDTTDTYILALNTSAVSYKPLNKPSASWGSITLTAGKYTVENVDYIGLQQLKATDNSITFTDVYTATAADSTTPRVIELNGVVYASARAYLTGSSIYQLFVKC